MHVEVFIGPDGQHSMTAFAEATEIRTTFLGKGARLDGEKVIMADGSQRTLRWDGTAFYLEYENGQQAAQLHVSAIQKL